MVLGLDGYDIGEGVLSPIPFERLFEYCIPRSRHLCLYHESENTNHEITIRSPKSSAHYQGKNLITSRTTQPQCRLGAFYRRLRCRLGAPKAITATAHKIAQIFYKLWATGGEYSDPGMDYYEQKYHEQILKHLQARAAALGLELVPIEQQLDEIFSSVPAPAT